MFSTLPNNAQEFMGWNWSDIEPYYKDLEARIISEVNVKEWLFDWSQLLRLLDETFNRLYVATSVDTTDEQAEERYNKFLDEIYPPSQAADQVLKECLLNSGLEPAGFEMPMRIMRSEAQIFRKQNIPLLAEELKISNEYDKIVGAQTITWDGEEVTLTQLKSIYLETNRERREKAWRLASQRQLVDRQTINELWQKLMNVRRQLAENADFPDYRAYRWVQLNRFDYTPENSHQFHQAIEKVAVPAMQRILERRRKRLGVKRLRPWDLNVDPQGRPPLHPFTSVEQLVTGIESIFQNVDPVFADYFRTMQTENLLDLDNRKGKAPGGYCTEYANINRPFIFMNAVGIQDDVLTLLHEGGHAFHVFETAHLPYIQQQKIGMEIAEVASMSMELLAAPYLTVNHGGFYTPEEAARARIENLELSINFWPYMAVVDAFQHWVYENHSAATDPHNCDAKWSQLWDRYMLGEDWSGLEDIKEIGWHQKLHIHQVPFYYIEYGLAQLGAFQVWRNAIGNQAAAVAAYRKALSLGATAPLPTLFETAGARFAFDVGTLQEAVELAEIAIEELDSIQG